MITRKRLKKHFYIMLILSIGLFISASIISFSVKNYYSPQKVTKRLNSEIVSAFSDLDDEIEIISKQDIDNRNTFLAFLDKKYKKAFDNRGIEILIYKNDSLTYWTDNVFSASILKEKYSNAIEVVNSGSGFYLSKQKKQENYCIVALQLVRYNYNYSNEYLPSGFYKRFSAPDNAEIELVPKAYKVLNKNGKFLFSLSFDKPFELSLWLQYLIFTLYVSSFLTLIAATFVLYMFLMREFGQKWLLYLVFIVDVIILRAIQFYFRFPADLYQNELFNPAFFASSAILPSLGDFLINALLGVQLIYFAFKQSAIRLNDTFLPKVNRTVSASLALISIIVLFYILSLTIKGLVLNSIISFRFENLLSLPHISHIGVLILSTLLFGFLLIFEILGQRFVKGMLNFKGYAFILGLSFISYLAFTYYSKVFDGINALFLLAILVVLFVQIRIRSLAKYKFSKVITLLIILSSFATYILNQAETTREHEKRKLLASHLSDARDNLAEYYFNEAAKKIKLDHKLAKTLSVEHQDSTLNVITTYIKDKYFSGYWNKYIVQVTVCQPDKQLSIKPGNIVTDCEVYFDDKINQFMRPVSVPGLFFLRQSIDAMYYLGKISISHKNGGKEESRNSIFIEISSNDIWKGLGYPELLIDKKNANVDNLSGYSYAFYKKGELIKNYGKFSFDIGNQNITDHLTNNGFYNWKGYNHFVYKADQDTMIVLSKESPRLSDLISPFSYIFLLLMIMLLLISGLKGLKLNWNLGIHTFRLRLQVIMISVIVVSSIVLVTVSLLFINTLNSNKNNEILSEKLNSVLIDLESRYGSISSFDRVSKEELSDLLLVQSNTYFTDVNIYNTKGFLLASSRDQIFREGMISEQISALSARQLMFEKKSVFIEKENIGSYNFLSAYTPIRNMDNQLIGYLNLPYFAKQEEIRREISGLITAFANIYIIMIVITILLALLLSRYITKPLQHIGNQFSMVKIGDKNAKIEWNRKDEIGRLVAEYNRMIDEMEKSAEMLARSERESAWRQMARQVAHEIKNPLTPIKLSMQLLMRAWNDKAPDWDVRLKRFSQTLIMQIDTLSSIATEFSDFAQMPEPQIQQFDVIPLVQQSAALFRDQSDCEISFETELSECIIKADPNQILRVFNNLIKNALQAIPGDRQGLVRISLYLVDNNCEISFQDNGTGIPTERQTRIFSPNFTTKTAGMGLGLAMVKNIIDNTSGRIWFETDPGEGTIFYVSLPMQD